MGLPNL